MRKIKYRNGILWLMLSICLLVMSGCSVEEQATTEDNGTFTCYTIDGQDRIIHGYQQKTTGDWYLFIPSGQVISEVDIHYTGAVNNVSSGSLDKNLAVVEDAFLSSGDMVNIVTDDGITHNVTILQSELPSVQIYLNNTTIDEVHADKNVKHPNNILFLSLENGTYDKVLEQVEIKGRGNTSWSLYEKKSYQIKFEQEQSILGMEPAKKWVLLSNATDDSMIRNQLVYQMAENMDMAFVPDFEYVDLWVDGEYLGTYMIGEKVEIEDSRLNLQSPRGALFEHDEAFYQDEEYWYYNPYLERHFTLKECATDKAVIEAQAINTFKSAIDEFIYYLFSTRSDEITLKDLSTMIDVDSFAKYYLINEYVLNQESYATSFFWYQDGENDVLHAGPIWDYDTCMGNDGADYSSSYGHGHILFQYLLAIPEFYAYTVELYECYKDKFDSMATNADILSENIKDSAKMNYMRWDVLGKETTKKDAATFAKTYEDAVDKVQTWITGRAEHFKIKKCLSVAGEVSDNQTTMEIFFVPDESYKEIEFAVFNVANKDKLVLWVPAELQDGVWCSTVDLTLFGEAGLYRMDVYEKAEGHVLTMGCSYVKNDMGM